jgi:hypothetical protein
MKEYVLIGLGAIVVALGISWLAQGDDFFLYQVFAPKYEAVRRKTFEETKSYNEGVAQELRSAQLNYAQAKTPEEKQAIASYVLHQTAGYDTTRLPPDLAAFLAQMAEAVSN